MMAMHYPTQMLRKDAELQPIHSTDIPQKTFAERKRLFSTVAQIIVSYKLHGKVEIGVNDIQLETEAENCSAIFINERVSRNSEFQEMLANSTCLAELKTLALMVLQR